MYYIPLHYKFVTFKFSSLFHYACTEYDIDDP